MHLRLMRTTFENPIPALLKNVRGKCLDFLEGSPAKCKGNFFFFVFIFFKGKVSFCLFGGEIFQNLKAFWSEGPLGFLIF